MTKPAYITCKELIEFLANYIDGTLAAPARHEFERHLGVCPSCVAYLDSYKKTIALGRAAMAPTDDAAAIPDRLAQAIRNARKTS